VFCVMRADPGHELSDGSLQFVEVNIWLHDLIDADVFSHRHPPFISITRFAGIWIRLADSNADGCIGCGSLSIGVCALRNL
jgi:hypothetical protein